MVNNNLIENVNILNIKFNNKVITFDKSLFST